MALETLDILNGTLSIFIIIVAFYVGIHIIIKYFEVKSRLFILVGMVAIITSEPWWPHSISFILVLSTGNGLSPELYFLMGNALIPIAILFWLIAFTDLMYEEKKKIILGLSIIYLAIYEIVLFSLVSIDHNLLGTLVGDIDVQYGIIMMGLLLIALCIILLTGLLFAKESLKSDNSEVKMKGKFLAVAFISYCTGAAIDAIFLSSFITLPIARILLAISAIGFLGGFIPPDWMKRIFFQKK